MENQQQVEQQDREHVEVFKALGHPRCILILKVLSKGSFGFVELKKTDIDSCGNLQQHLTKIDGLVKAGE